MRFLNDFILTPLLVWLSTMVIAAKPLPEPPPTERHIVKDELHGVTIEDPYRWLEDKDASKTREWIQKQKAYTDKVLSRVDGREIISDRLTELMRVDEVGTPIVRGQRYFFSKRTADRDLSVIAMRKGPDGEDEVLVDPKDFGDDETRTVDLLDVSEDGTLLVYGIREGGEDEIRVRLFDVDERKNLDGGLPKARYFGVTVTPDGEELFYARHSEEGSRVFRRSVADPTAEEQYLFGEDYGPGKGIAPDLSSDGRYLIIQVFHGSAAQKTEIYYKDLKQDGPIRPVVNDVEARFTGEAVGDTLYLKTNWKAPNGRILAVDLKHPERENWKEIVPEGDGVIEGVSPVGGRLFVNVLQNVQSRVKVVQPDGTFVRKIAFPAMGTVSGVGGRWDQDEAFFSFSSFHLPKTIYRHNVSTGEQEVWWRASVPVDSEQFALKQVWYKSKDGTEIPMFLLHRKGLELDGNRPTLLYGYGGFNISLTPRFSARMVTWVEQGGVFAVANLRGGGEFGEEWHRAGMRENKQNVFDDFIAAAEWLIDNGYTNSDRLAISGGSNGGLLVGAALTQRPDLFRAVVCSYPLLDMIRFHKFLVAEFWVPEYGSAEDPEQFRYLLDYSPYHNVEKGAEYPAVLFITGDSDTRVAPLHARKMTALLQWANGSDRPILLHYDTELGHSGGRPVSKRIEDLTAELSFLFDQLDVSVTQW